MGRDDCIDDGPADTGRYCKACDIPIDESNEGVEDDGMCDGCDGRYSKAMSRDN